MFDCSFLFHECSAAKEQFDPVRSIHIYSVQHTKLKVHGTYMHMYVYTVVTYMKHYTLQSYSIMHIYVHVCALTIINSLVVFHCQDSCTLFSADYDMCKEHVTTYSRYKSSVSPGVNERGRGGGGLVGAQNVKLCLGGPGACAYSV